MMPLVDVIGIADKIRMVGRMSLRDGIGIPPSVFIFARENPVTGASLPDQTKPIIPMIQPTTMHKNRFAEVCKAVAIAANAYSTIVVFDSWYARVTKADGAKLTGTPDEKLAQLRASMPASLEDYEERQSALMVAIELEDGRSLGSHQVYRSDEGGMIFEPTEWIGGTRESRRSTWQLLPDREKFGEPPAEVVASCRNVSAFMLQGVDWLPPDFVSRTAEDEQAQVNGHG